MDSSVPSYFSCQHQCLALDTVVVSQNISWDGEKEREREKRERKQGSLIGKAFLRHFFVDACVQEFLPYQFLSSFLKRFAEILLSL